MKRSRPSFENLEDRCVPVTWGNPWADAANLTLSFAPDETAVGNRSSELFQTLDLQANSPGWQQEILRAFQTWAVAGNINIGLVEDQGQAFGSAGRPQGDDRFGDVRIAAYEMASDVLAIATPYEATAGTWAGDVKLNSAYNFGVGGNGDIDLYTAMLHEAAHVYGLDHSTDPNSGVFARYLGQRTTGLTAEDTDRIQELYGVREADQFEGAFGNDSLGRATQLSLIGNSDGSLGFQVEADITTLNDVDVYKFRAPLNTGSFNIRLNAAGLSLLNARIKVYNSRGREIGSDVSTDPFNNDLLVRVSRARSLATYYVKVDASREDVFGIGGYRLQVESIPALGALTKLVKNTANNAKEHLNNDLHTDDTFLSASLLPPVLSQTASRFDYAFKGSISDGWDVDIYRVQAPHIANAEVMSVMVWGTENGGLHPQVTVYDSRRQEVEADLLVNENGIFIVQVTGAEPGTEYFVKVHPADAKGAHNIGNYFLGVDFGKEAVQLGDISTGRLNAGSPQLSETFVSAQSQLYHFTLSADAAPATGVSVRMTILDGTGNVVATMKAESGQPAASSNVYLVKGSYTLRYAVETRNGEPAPNVEYRLRGARISDPIGPQPDDPTDQPAGSPSPSSSSSTSSSSNDPATTADSDANASSSPPPDGTTTTGSSQTDSQTQTSPPAENSSESPPAEQTSPPPANEEEANSSSGQYSYNYGDNRGLEEEDPYDYPYQTY